MDDDEPSLDFEELPIVCPKCEYQMRLFGIEWETERRESVSYALVPLCLLDADLTKQVPKDKVFRSRMVKVSPPYCSEVSNT